MIYCFVCRGQWDNTQIIRVGYRYQIEVLTSTVIRISHVYYGIPNIMRVQIELEEYIEEYRNVTQSDGRNKRAWRARRDCLVKNAPGDRQYRRLREIKFGQEKWNTCHEGWMENILTEYHPSNKETSRVPLDEGMTSQVDVSAFSTIVVINQLNPCTI